MKKRLIFKLYKINFDLGEHYKKDGTRNGSRFTFSMRKTVMF